MSVKSFNFCNIRIYDIFFSGPVYIYISTKLQNRVAKYIFLIIGISTLLYNLINLLIIDLKVIKYNDSYSYLIHKVNGKTNLHRLYNIIIMYPIMYWLIQELRNTEPQLYILCIMMIIIGFIYNLYYYIKINRINKINKINKFNKKVDK